MKHTLLLALLLILNTFFCTAQNKFKVIALGFYNVENFFDTINDPNKRDDDFTPDGSYHNTPDVYAQKLYNMTKVFSLMGTDLTPDGPAIIGMAELENDNVLKDIVVQPSIKDRNYKYEWHPTPDERGISTAMIYNPKYFTVLDSKPLRVPVEKLGQKRPTRDILFVSGILAGDTVHVLVNHWPSKSGGEAASAPGRKLAASVGRHTIDSLLAINPNAKILLMGDLNDEPTSEAVIDVLKCTEDKERMKSTELYNPWIKLYKKGIGTENYKGEWHLIDQMILSYGFVKNPNNKWKYHSAKIFNEDFLTNQIGKDKGLPHRSYNANRAWDNGFSDHFPVVIYMVEKL